MDKQNLLALASKLILASTTGNDTELQKVSEELAQTLLQPDEGTSGNTPVPETNFTGILKFNKQELNEMPKSFKKYFIADGCAICYRKRTTNGYKCSYEVRYRRHGYNISVSATSLPIVKARFIEALCSTVYLLPLTNFQCTTLKTTANEELPCKPIKMIFGDMKNT